MKRSLTIKARSGSGRVRVKLQATIEADAGAFNAREIGMANRQLADAIMRALAELPAISLPLSLMKVEGGGL